MILFEFAAVIVCHRKKIYRHRHTDTHTDTFRNTTFFHVLSVVESESAIISNTIFFAITILPSVSYTHLDVYKRQHQALSNRPRPNSPVVLNFHNIMRVAFFNHYDDKSWEKHDSHVAYTPTCRLCLNRDKTNFEEVVNISVAVFRDQYRDTRYFECPMVWYSLLTNEITKIKIAY